MSSLPPLFARYVNLSPQLYGTNLSTVAPPFDRIINQEAGSYRMGNVSVLLHLHGLSPSTKGESAVLRCCLLRPNGSRRSSVRPTELT